MKYNLAFGVLGIVLGISCTDTVQETSTAIPKPSVSSTEDGICEGVVRVKFRAEVDTKKYVGAVIADAQGRRFQVREIIPVFSQSKRFEKRHKAFGLNLWYDLRLEAETGVATRAAVASCAVLPEVSYAGPVAKIQTYSEGSYQRVTNIPRAVNRQGGLPNDPLLSKQWHYDAAVSPYLAEANIHLFGAWKETMGDPKVIVAINDGGVDYTHEDLAPNMWRNPGETPNDGIDNDENGCVDDVYGYDFLKNSGDLSFDDHATHVAGTVAAVNGNGIGVCGIAGGKNGNGDGVRIMTCRMISTDYSEDDINRAACRAFEYSADMGAVISQNSWGYQKIGMIDSAVLHAIDYFVQYAGCDENGIQTGPMKGGVVLFAAGNLHLSGPIYPGAYESCIAVAATDIENKRGTYSNYGEYIDICAPGGTILQTQDECNILSTIVGNGYAYKTGTSMACPHVSGVAALIISRYGKPGFTNEDLKKRLLGATHPLKTWDANYAPFMGNGLVDATLALKENDGKGPHAVTGLHVDSRTGDLCWTAVADEEDGLARFYRIYYSEQPLTAENYIHASYKEVNNTVDEAGATLKLSLDWMGAEERFYFTVIAYDRWENPSAFGTVVQYPQIEPQELRMYPNPVINRLQLDWGEDFKGKCTITIFDMSGRAVWNGETASHEGSMTLNLAFLPGGIYTLRFESETRTETRKITKR